MFGKQIQLKLKMKTNKTELLWYTNILVQKLCVAEECKFINRKLRYKNNNDDNNSISENENNFISCKECMLNY